MNDFFYDSCTLILEFSIPGIFLAMVYDAFRLLRIGRNDPHHKPLPDLKKKYFPRSSCDLNGKRRISDGVLVFIEDIGFCLIAAFTEILAIYHINRGEIRIYCLMVSVVAFVIYQKTLGKLFLLISTRILYLLRYLAYGLGCLVLTPTLFIWKVGKRIAIFFKKAFHKKHSTNLF